MNFYNTSFPPAYLFPLKHQHNRQEPLLPKTQTAPNPRHYSLVTLVTGGSCRAAGTGQALLALLLREEALGTAVAAWPLVASQAQALPRRAVASSAAHRAAVAQGSCKETETQKSHNC